jgi:hypothetical protein
LKKKHARLTIKDQTPVENPQEQSWQETNTTKVNNMCHYITEAGFRSFSDFLLEFLTN